MGVGLGWLGIAVGLVGCVATYLMAASARRPVNEDPGRKRACLAASCALVLTLLFWAISMQRHPPFSMGQALGLGFLIGGLAGTIAIAISSRLASVAPGRARLLSTHATASLGLFAVSLTYVIFHTDPKDALIGFSIGIALAGILDYFARDSEDALSSSWTESWAIFSITVAAGILLAVNHFNTTPLRTWWPLPILLATTGLIASYIGVEIGALGKLQAKPGMSRCLSALVAGAVVIALSAIYSWRIVASWELLEVVALGVVIAGVIEWLSATLGDTESGALESGAATVVLIAALAAACFKIWAGMGMALALIAAWAIVLPRAVSRTLERALTLGIVILLFRLFVQSYKSDLSTVDLRTQYPFVGALFGAVLPFILTASLVRIKSIKPSSPRAGAIWTLGSIMLMGLFSTAVPLLVYVLWDFKAVIGFLFGLSAAMAFMILQPTASKTTGAYSVGLLAVGAELIALQFVGPLGDLELTRTVRILILAAAAALWLIWFVATNVAARRAE